MDTVDLALACYRTPLAYQDRLSLAAPLPEDMDRLLWLANGSPEILDAAVRQTGAKPGELRDAARFCIQQWCLARGADSHRLLGIEPGASPERIKEHYRLLIRLFHPDRAGGRESWTDHYASRINEAWTALSRTPDRAMPESRSHPPQVPAQDALRPRVERLVERPEPRSSRHLPGHRSPSRRRRLSGLALGGLMLAALLALGGFYLEQVLVNRGGFQPTGVADSDPPAGEAPVPSVIAVPITDPGAFGPFLAAPDWRALEQREQQVQRQAAQAREAREQWEEDRRQRIEAEEALLESMRAEHTELDEQVKNERARVEQVRTEQAKVAQAQVERRRFEEQLKIERARVEAVANRVPATPVVVAAMPEEPKLTAGELEGLMNRYTRAYQRGDLSGVMALFAAGARGRIEKDYATLFAEHDVRGLWLHDLRWVYRGPSASGSGRYELQLQQRDNGERHQVEGSIRFTVQKRDGRVLIEAIEFDWPKS